MISFILDQLNDFSFFFSRFSFFKNKKYTVILLIYLTYKYILNTLRIILSNGQSLRAIKFFIFPFCSSLRKLDSIECETSIKNSKNGERRHKLMNMIHECSDRSALQ